MKLSLDYETRSQCDLKLAGTYVYARHPSTRVLCAAYSIDDAPERIWPAAAGHRMPPDLREALDKAEAHAWNAQFERLITKHVLKIDVPLKRWRCTAALARARGLPGKLESALDFLGEAPSLAAKRDGKAIMLKWCRPLPDGTWANDAEEYMRLLHYCMDDVRSEKLVANRLVPLSPELQAEYELNERVNDLGLPVDRALALAAQAYGAEEKRELSELLHYMTGGRITTTSQHQRIKDWLAEHMSPEMFALFFTRYFKKRQPDGEFREVLKVTTDKAARADFLMSEEAKDVDPEVSEVIELIDDAGKASVAKYARIAARAADNGRAEGAYVAWGAIQTKRYSSVGVQSHNFPRKGLPDVPGAIQQVLEHKVQGKVMHVLAALLRPTVMASAARVLVWGDWSAVEARGMPWLAGCEWKLDLHRRNVDVYKRNARDIFGTPEDEVEDHERQVGKVSELSLQFGGARGALKAMARGYGITLDNAAADVVVARWRAANKWAMQFSTALYQAFMHTAIGVDTAVGPVSYRQIDPLLPGTVSIACDLPGGTTLYYHGVRGTVVMEHPVGQIKREVSADIGDSLDVFPVNSWDTDVKFVKTMPGGFRTDRIWHGLLAENVTQAICAALLRDCLRRVEMALAKVSRDMHIVGHTHDEIILEVPLGRVKQAITILNREMRRVPEWLPGFPLACEVKSGPRYVK